MLEVHPMCGSREPCAWPSEEQPFKARDWKPIDAHGHIDIGSGSRTSLPRFRVLALQPQMFKNRLLRLSNVEP